MPISRGLSVLEWVAGAAQAAEPESQDILPPKAGESHNADGNFLIVPQEAMEREKNQSAGIGVTIVKNGRGAILIGGVADASPAKSAGLRTGDVIVSVDGRKTEGLPVTMVSQWLRGRDGTLVVLRIKDKDGKMRKVSLNRSELSSFGAPKKPDVTLKKIPLAQFKSTACPGEADGCHFLSKDDDICVFTCRVNH